MYRIGIFGSAQRETERIEGIAEKIGILLARQNCVIVTGACSGLPYIAACTAARQGGTEVHGFSPTRSLEEQRLFTPEDDLSIYACLHFLPPGLPSGDNFEAAKKYRNVASTAICDAGIILAGRWGTLHEVCSLIDFGRVVGLMLGTGGVADRMQTLGKALHPSKNAEIIADNDPEELVRRLFERLDLRNALP